MKTLAEAEAEFLENRRKKQEWVRAQKCASCKIHQATTEFSFDNEGRYTAPYCDCCVLKAQLKYAQEYVAKIDEVRARISKLSAKLEQAQCEPAITESSDVPRS